jgi:hypothetical protein
MPATSGERRIATVPAAGLADILAAAGFTGPVLLVADDAAIAAWAPAWAASLAGAGVVYRVVIHGVDVAAAAAGLNARVVVVAGATAVPAAAAAAAALGLPLVAAPGAP